MSIFFCHPKIRHCISASIVDELVDLAYGLLVERVAYPIDLAGRYPALGDHALLIEAEHVHRVVDGLHLLHLAQPRAHMLRGVHEQRASQAHRLVEHGLELVEACRHAMQHLLALVQRLRTRIQSRLETAKRA